MTWIAETRRNQYLLCSYTTTISSFVKWCVLLSLYKHGFWFHNCLFCSCEMPNDMFIPRVKAVIVQGELRVVVTLLYADFNLLNINRPDCTTTQLLALDCQHACGVCITGCNIRYMLSVFVAKLLWMILPNNRMVCLRKCQNDWVYITYFVTLS